MTSSGKKRSAAQIANTKRLNDARHSTEQRRGDSDTENQEPPSRASSPEPCSKRRRLSGPPSPSKKPTKASGSPRRSDLRQTAARTRRDENAALRDANVQLHDENAQLHDANVELRYQLHTAQAEITSVNELCISTRRERDHFGELYAQAKRELAAEQAAHAITASSEMYYHQRTLRLQREKKKARKEADAELRKATAELTDAVARHTLTSHDAAAAAADTKSMISALESSIREHESTEGKQRGALTDLRKKLAKFQRKARRAKLSNNTYRERSRGVRNEKKAPWLTGERGTYSPKTRQLILALLNAGVGTERVGGILQCMGDAFGVKVGRSLSSRTAGRIAIEAGVLVDMQLAYNIMAVDPSKNQGIAASDDSTSHRYTTYHGKHLTMPTPPYISNPKSSHMTFEVGVDAIIDHTSGGQLSSWKKKEEVWGGTWNGAPVARRLQKRYRRGTVFIKTTTRHTDHAADEKKQTRLWEDEKRMLIQELMGEEAAAKFSDEEIEALLAEKCVLSPQFKLEPRDAVILAVSLELGAAAFDRLSDADQERLTFILQAGCCAHKDKNTVEAYSKAIRAVLVRLGIALPVALPNAPNAAAIRADPNGVAAQQAEAASSGGAIKLLQLVAAICNNKDDKRGQQDFHRNFMTERKLSRLGPNTDVARVTAKFPGVSNNRYQSYPRAAIELLVNLSDYRDLFKVIKLKKGTPGWTNIEANVNAALHDDPTLIELATLAIYYLIISAPYMLAARAPDINFCDLGPLHDNVHAHLKYLVENPQLLAASGLSTRGKQCTLDGDDWADLEAINAIESLMMRLPKLHDAILGGLEGVMPAWERFTEEFEAGGKLDLMDTTERLLHFCPATNDVNESILGRWRVWSRRKPSGNVQTFSALTAYQFNHTADFVDKVLEPEDMSYVRAEARKRIESNEPKAFREAQVVHETEKARENEERIVAKADAARELWESLNSIAPITDDEVIRGLKCKQLLEQIERLRIVEKHPYIVGLLKKKYKLRAQQIEVLLKAVHHQDESTPGPSQTQPPSLDDLPIVEERLPVEESDDEDALA